LLSREEIIMKGLNVKCVYIYDTKKFIDLMWDLLITGGKLTHL